MMNKTTFKLRVTNQLNDLPPLSDQRWIPEGENLHFLPCCLDLLHDSYSGFWHLSMSMDEPEHYNTGLFIGNILQGVLTVKTKDEIRHFHSGMSFLVPPHTIYSVSFSPEKENFLMFGAITGKSQFVGIEENFGISTYLKMVKEHYQKYGLSLEHIIYG